MIELYNDSNEKNIYDLLFMFNDNNKDFIVYKDINDEILASFYEKDGDKIIVKPIMEDSDYDIVDKRIEEWWKSDEE